MENLGKLTVSLLMFIVGFFIHMLSSYIVLSISNLYEIEFISSMSYLQIFGLMYVVSIFKYTYKTNKDVGFKDNITKAVNAAMASVIFYLLVWAMASLLFSILN